MDHTIARHSGDTTLSAVRSRWRKVVQSRRPAEIRVGILATYTIDSLTPYLGVYLEEAGHPADIRVGAYNQIVQQCLEDHGPIAQFHPDILIVCPRLEELWAGKPLPFAEEPEDYSLDTLLLAETVIASTMRWGASLIFLLPAIPEVRPSGIGDEGNIQGVFAVATAVREALRRKLADASNVFILDMETIIREVGSERAYNYAMFNFAKIPFTEEIFARLGERLVRILCMKYDMLCQALVIDADSVLFDDIQGQEDQVSTLYSLKPGSKILLPYLRQIKHMGIKILFCSSGREESIWQTLSMYPYGRLEELFDGWQVGPRPVDEKLRGIAKELGIDIHHQAFLSCNATLIEKLKKVNRLKLVLSLSDDPDNWIQEIQRAGVLDKFPPKKKREEQQTLSSEPYQSPEDQLESLSLDSFLASLNVQLACTPLEIHQVSTVIEMFQSAHDFNLAAVEYTEEEIVKLLETKEEEFVSIQVSDRFGNYGVSGVLGFSFEGEVCKVDVFLLSCPVLGKGVEDLLVDTLIRWAKEHLCSRLVFLYQPTGRNGPIIEFLSKVELESRQQNQVRDIAIDFINTRRGR